MHILYTHFPSYCVNDNKQILAFSVPPVKSDWPTASKFPSELNAKFEMDIFDKLSNLSSFSF